MTGAREMIAMFITIGSQIKPQNSIGLVLTVHVTRKKILYFMLPKSVHILLKVSMYSEVILCITGIS